MLRRFLDSPWLYFVGAALLALLAVASQFEIGFQQREVGTVDDIAALRERDDTNVVFILIDTLRADRLSAYGYERPTSPTLEELAANGILFRNTVSQSSWTKTSMAALWTSTHPVRNGMLRYLHSLPEEVETPAEIFREAGFRTVGLWRNGWVAPNFGFSQGFDIYLKPRISSDQVRLQRRSPSAHSLPGSDEDIVLSTQEFLTNFGNDRFFLYLHMMDLHQYVYDETAPEFGPSYSDFYDRSVSWSDRVVGAIVRELENHELLGKTIIVVASDHGEAFLEHGLEGHAQNLYGEVTQVPFIVSLPFRLEPGIEVDALVGNLDIWPTVLDLMGLRPMPGVDGVSRVPQILASGGAAPVPSEAGELLAGPVFAQLDRNWGQTHREPDSLVSVTQDSLRLFVRLREPEKAELYDLAADPGETRDLAAERPEDVERMRALVDDHMGRSEAPWGTHPQEVEIDAMQLGQLRALGYAIE